MKKIIRFSIILASLLASRVAQGQGTIYLSNLNQTPNGSDPVGSDSWLASAFLAGTDVNGYELNSVQLAMADASGNPSDFTVMIYAQNPNIVTGPFLGSSLGTLTGSSNPSNVGVYTYTSDLSLILSPSTTYFVVLTAGTTVANGAYEWNFAGLPSRNNGWGEAGSILDSVDGMHWSFENSGSAQFAVAATAIPEPSLAFFLLLGSGILMYVRRIFHRQSA